MQEKYKVKLKYQKPNIGRGIWYCSEKWSNFCETKWLLVYRKTVMVKKFTIEKRTFVSLPIAQITSNGYYHQDRYG